MWILWRAGHDIKLRRLPTWVVGPLGLLAGPFLGALLGELWHTRALRRATHVGLATWLGLLLGTVLKLALAFAMLGLFVLAWFL